MLFKCWFFDTKKFIIQNNAVYFCFEHVQELIEGKFSKKSKIGHLNRIH